MYLLWYAARSVSRYILFCPSTGESMFQHSVLRFHGISFKVFLLKPRRSIGRTRKVPYPVLRPGCLTAGTLVSTIRCDAPFRSSLFLQHCCIFRITCSAVLTILAGRIWFSFLQSSYVATLVRGSQQQPLPSPEFSCALQLGRAGFSTQYEEKMNDRSFKLHFKVFLFKPRRSIGRARKAHNPYLAPPARQQPARWRKYGRCDASFRSSRSFQHS